MQTFLIFTLYGPMASWGDTAVGEYRPSFSCPSKSAVLGLVAAALGIDRTDDATLARLNEEIGFGARLDAEGKLERDYHTIQVPPRRKGITFRTRRAELLNESLYTILSSRDYRIESRSTIALWQAVNVASFDLTSLEAALRQPHYIPYLGRKSCPLALPMQPAITDAPSLRAAFDLYTPPLPGLFDQTANANFIWERLSPDEAGMSPSMEVKRRDQLISRSRWQFTDRDEYLLATATGEPTDVP